MVTYRISDECPRPEKWHGQHYLKCVHQLNHQSEICYQMFCNVLKTMPDGRLKIEVFGERYWKDARINKSRIRYVDSWRVGTETY